MISRYRTHFRSVSTKRTSLDKDGAKNFSFAILSRDAFLNKLHAINLWGRAFLRGCFDYCSKTANRLT